MTNHAKVIKWTTSPKLRAWLEESIYQLDPSSVHFCDGSFNEYESLCNSLVQKGTFIPLNPEKRPGSFYCRSDPSDVARVEECTFICSQNPQDAGPTNNWRDPKEMKELLRPLFKGCMKGRTMYVIPFVMGPIGSSFAINGVQITDSAYVAVNMYHMTHMGEKALEQINIKDDFVPCLHSVGVPLKEGDRDAAWPCQRDKKYIVHFPETREVWSFGSGYGGNALLGKKSLALRIASAKAKDEGWLAEHMLIVGITNPEGEKKYIAAAFPSSCGKTNLALLSSTLPGWKIECVGDDIAWMRFGKDGRLYAVNPEAGFFGVAPGTSEKTCLNAIKTITHDTIFTNVALRGDGDVWWEGLSEELPENLWDWKGQSYSHKQVEPASHPNARFTVSIRNCPILDPSYDNLEGVPISAIIFGGRRQNLEPLVYESLGWNHGVFLGAALSSETTAAAKGETGKVRHDPFAMLPFCGYNMGDYFAHWLAMGNKSHNLPVIYHVNWFKKNAAGDYLWPGFSANIHVLRWIFERCSKSVQAEKSPLGLLPNIDFFKESGVSKEAIKELFSIDKDAWKKEIVNLKAYFSTFKEKLPKEISQELQNLNQRLD